MKICQLSSAHGRYDTRIFYKECTSLVKYGHKVVLLLQHHKDENINGIKIIALRRAPSRLYRIFILTNKILINSFKLNADAYHFHDPELIIAAFIIKNITNKIVIYDVHEDISKQILSKFYLPKKLRKMIAFFVHFIELTISKQFDAIITSTDDIAKKFSYHKNVVAIKNYPVLENYPKIQVKNRLKKEESNLIYVGGGLIKIRGISEIIKALEYVNKHKAVKLILCGKFNPKAYELEVKSMKAFDRVNHVGWLESYKIPKLLEKADIGLVCLHPTKNYITSLPVKMFEYMAAGIPIIASKFPLWENIIERNNCGLCVNPLDPREIADAILYLINNPKIAREMGENGYQMTLKEYNWYKESIKLKELYANIL